MRGKQWPKSKQIEVFESYALSESLAVTSRESGVAKSTVKRWVERNSEQVEAIRKRNQEIANRAIAESLETRMREIAEFGRDIRLKALELLPNLRRATPSGVAALGRAAVEIEFKGLGRPSEVLELRGKVIDEAIERELEKLARAKEEELSSEPGPSAEES